MMEQVKDWLANHVRIFGRLHMVMQKDDYGHLVWVSRETNENGEPLVRRAPQPVKYKYERGKPFAAAGYRYKNLSQLNAYRKLGLLNHLYEDTYGRTVLYFEERYPCFDSYDCASESRYNYWYFLCVNGRLTCVHYGDGRWIEVEEDVGAVYEKWMKEMKKLGWAR